MPLQRLSLLCTCLLLCTMLLDAASTLPRGSIPRGTLPRGGGPSYSSTPVYSWRGIFGWLGGPRKSAAQQYRETLQEQVLMLDRQLRQAREEIAVLRQASKQRRRSTTSSSADKSLTAQQVKTLQGQVKQLEGMKKELTQLLEGSTARVAELEAKLAEQESLTIEMEAQYTSQLQELQAQLEQQAAAQLEQWESMMEEKIEQAAEQARQEEWAKVKSKIAEVTEHMQRQHDKALQEERARSAKLVEAEKKKMRKLVKALAIREHKLWKGKVKQDDDNLSTTSRTRTAVVPKTSTIPVGKPKTTPTTRGPI